MRPAQRPALRLIVLCFALAFLDACVSVELNKAQPISRSENIIFTEPAKPFTALKTTDLDRGWHNPKNGNSISYITECGGGVDPSLENIHNGIIKGVSRVETIKKEKLTYNGRDALRALITGSVDGVTSKIDFLIFKKNGCNYILTYVSLDTTFDQNAADFQKFIDEFRAP